MKQSIQLRLGQHLTMTPQLQQAIRLLQLSTAELSMEVQQALDSNMMLELAEDENDDASIAEELLGPDLAAPAAGDTVGERADSAVQDEEVPAQDIPEELPVDSAWDDIYDGAVAGSGSSAEGTSGDFESQRSGGETLRDHLSWQINLCQLNEVDLAIAMTLIDSINSDGYLTMSLEDIQQSLVGLRDDPIELDEIEAVLHHIQALDPPGVGARDLRECLLLQLAQCDASTPWLKEARTLVADHLDVLAAHDYNQLMRRMKLGREELQKVIALIQSMNPRPGSHLEAPQIEYIVPDVYVRKKKGVWQVELNVDAIPHLRINRQYASMIRRADNSPDNSSLKAHLQEARWFIKSLQSRSETLLRVATAIVERQRAFLEHGEEAMKPLVLHDIAEALGMHESTISRVTTRKYMHTPRGIYELKYFFSSHVSTDSGGEASSTAIRAVIKKLIAAENCQKPLSDSKIAAVLSEQGVNVARRTVAKYREAMAIPPSNERKRLG